MKQTTDQFMENMINNFEPHEKKAAAPDYVKQIEEEVSKQLETKLKEAAKEDPTVVIPEKKEVNELPEDIEKLEEENEEGE